VTSGYAIETETPHHAVDFDGEARPQWSGREAGADEMPWAPSP
jgi:hypothetical protein